MECLFFFFVTGKLTESLDTVSAGSKILRSLNTDKIVRSHVQNHK